MSPKETELAAFAVITRSLEDAADDAARIRALGRNHGLWSTLVKDLAMAENALPAGLKAELVALGTWSMHYSTLAILRKLSVQPLIDVNRNIADGLASQVLLPDPPAAAEREHAASV